MCLRAVIDLSLRNVLAGEVLTRRIIELSFTTIIDGSLGANLHFFLLHLLLNQIFLVNTSGGVVSVRPSKNCATLLSYEKYLQQTLLEKLSISWILIRPNNLSNRCSLFVCLLVLKK